MNLVPNGMFKPMEEVRSGLQELAGSHAAQDLVHIVVQGLPPVTTYLQAN